MNKKKDKNNKKWVRIIINAVAAIFLYLLFSFSMFLGLQVKPMYGNIGIIVTVGLLILYVWLYKKINKD